MSASAPRLFICSCDNSMPIDAAAIERGCGARAEAATQLCGVQLDRFKAALGDTAPLVIACTQEAPLFQEVAEEHGFAGPLTFANIRETASWSADAKAAGPKTAALLAAAQEEMPSIALVTMESAGVALIYGHDEVAIAAAEQLAERLDITVVLSRPGDVTPRRSNDFPILKGTIRNAGGVLGGFALTIDEFALPLPSSRQKLAFAPARNGATSHCDILLDLSGGRPLFPAHEVRDGYLRADPRDPAAVQKAIFDAANLVGTFDKPKYINFSKDLCAHSRSGITGCTRCLDLCPTGAIVPAGDAVAIDAAICAGCGSCAAACPTGAAAYALPSADALIRRLRTLMQTYLKAGGANAIVLFHDEEHGEALIHALARFGDGLPANVLPVRVNEISQVGPEAIAALFAYGATGVRLLARAKPRHGAGGLQAIVNACDHIVSSLGFGTGVVSVIETDDPDVLGQALRTGPAGVQTAQPAALLPRGGKRGVLESVFRELHVAAPTPVSVIALEKGAPFGGVHVDTAGCTLCHACVTACPTGALGDNPDKPMLRFTESLCVQCGLCEATCPEDVISLVPRLDFDAWRAPAATLKEEEPYHCIACQKPFGTKSTIERIVAKLQEKHWMFSGANAKRIDVVRMCDTCRTTVAVNESFDPHQANPRPPVMTTDDYLRLRAEKGKDPL